MVALIVLAISLFAGDSSGVSLTTNPPIRLQSGDPDPADIAEVLEHARDIQLDLNTARLEDLEELPGITTEEAQSIIAFREKILRFTSLDQLRVIEQAGPELYERLQAYVFVDPGGKGVARSRLPFASSRSRMTRSSIPIDHDTIATPLASWKLYEQIRLQPLQQISLNLTAVRAAGERLRMGVLCGNAAIRGLPLGGYIVVGDFEVDEGRGLVLPRSSEMLRNDLFSSRDREASTRIRPYRGTSELAFFRGVAIQSNIVLRGYTMNVSGFVSRRLLPAALDDGGKVTSFYADGTYRTVTDCAKRNTYDQRLAGGTIAILRRDWHLTVEYLTSHANRAVAGWDVQQHRDPDEQVFGIEGEWRFDRLRVYGESAVNTRRASAVHVGVELGVLGRLTALIDYRRGDPDFTTPHDDGETANLQKWTLGLLLPISSSCSMRGSAELSNRNWRTYTIPTGSTSRKFDLEFTELFPQGAQVHARWIHKAWQDGETVQNPAGSAIRLAVDRNQDRLAAIGLLRYEPGGEIRIRADWTCVTEGTGGGILHGAAAEIGVRMRLLRWISADGGAGWFSTDGYNAALYVFEADLPGLSSTRCLFGGGFRSWFRAEITANRQFTLSLKYSEVVKEGGIDSTTRRENPLSRVWWAGFQLDLRMFD